VFLLKHGKLSRKSQVMRHLIPEWNRLAVTDMKSAADASLERSRQKTGLSRLTPKTQA
jgi:hypothetical protein